MTPGPRGGRFDPTTRRPDATGLVLRAYSPWLQKEGGANVHALLHAHTHSPTRSHPIE